MVMMSRGIAGFVVVVVILLCFGAYVSYNSTTSQTTSTSNSIQGVVTGLVTVGPSQPICSANQSCTVDLSGYSLEFTSTCGVASCQTFLATISPSGHYAILLSPGQYSITGIVPSCNWLGCSSAFPRTVEVTGGSQLVVDISIDTGIR